jgi:SAM-dependent methyltransferase
MTATLPREDRRVLDANIAVHTRLAADYARIEPHYRPENVARVGRRLRELVHQTRASALLDLGCGAGFIIDIARTMVDRITGVDATQAMLDRVNRDGPAEVELIQSDSATVDVPVASYDMVTAYSFLHHLYDIAPTVRTAFEALRPGGVFYADLDPNYEFWRAVAALDPDAEYDPVVTREIAQVRAKGDQIQERYGISADVFDDAEYGKNRLGGFRAQLLAARLRQAGFSRVEVFYHWFLGQGRMINDPNTPRAIALAEADATDLALQRGLPLTKHLFKYLGIIAWK